MNFKKAPLKKHTILASVLFLPLLLSACDFFDRMGDHLPVLGDRCENWQCFTTSGQEASDAKKSAIQQQQAGVPNPATSATTPAPSASSQPAAPAKASAPTPFDADPSTLSAMPPPTSPNYHP